MGKNLVEIIVTAEDKASGVLKGIGSSLKMVGSAAVAGIGVGAAALGGLAAGITSLAASAAPVAGLQKGFEALTGSMEGGSAAMLAALQDASGGLITNTDLMQSFNQAAALVSTDFAERLPNAMDYLSKVSAATGQDMGFMLDSLVKGVGRLSPMILDNLGIQVSLTEANEIYAASIGKSADELTKAEQQTALMNQVMEKLAANTEGMEGMSNPFEQFKVTMANLKDEIGLRLLPVVAPMMERFGELAQRVIPLVMDVVDKLIGKLEPVGAAFETIVDVVGSFIFNLEEGMSPLDAFIEAIRGIVPPGLIERFTEVKDRLLEFIGPIVDSITQFVTWKDVLIAAAVGIAALVIPAIISIITAMAPILLTVGAVIAIVALLRNAWENNWGGIQEKTQAVIDFIRPLIENALAAIRAWWEQNGAAIMAAVQRAWDLVRSVVSTVITFIANLIQAQLAAIQAFWQAHGAAIVATATQAWNLIKGVIDGVIKIIKGIIDAFRLAFQGEWEALGRKIFEIWKTAWDTVVNFLKGLWGMVLPWLSSLWQNIQSWWSGIDWGSLGRNLVSKIVSGLQAAGGAIISTLMGFAKAAWDAVIGFFKGGASSAAQGQPNKSGQMLGFSRSFALSPGAMALAGGGRTVVVNVDARGAAPGVERDVRRAVDEALRAYGLKADARMRTGG